MEIEQTLIEQSESRSNEPIGLWQLFKGTLPLGFITFGGPISHVAVFEREFVRKRGWISKQEFTELILFVQCHPGPPSILIVLAVGTLLARSPIGGLVAYFNFFLPSSTCLLLAAYFLSDESHFPHWGKVLMEGICFSAISLVYQATHRLTVRTARTTLTQSILILSAVTHFLLPHPLLIIVIIFLGGLFNVILEKTQAPEEKPFTNQEALFTAERTKPLVRAGKASLFIYFVLLFTLLGLHIAFPHSYSLRLMFNFYKFSSILFGGAHVVFPMIYSEFSDKLEVFHVLKGFSMFSLLPGPYSPIFSGFILHRFLGSLLCFLFMLLPSILIIWSSLPFWIRYRDNVTFRKTIRGLSAAAVGLIYVIIVKFLMSGGADKTLVAAAVSIFSYCMLDIWGWPAPIALGFGALLRLFICNDLLGK